LHTEKTTKLLIAPALRSSCECFF